MTQAVLFDLEGTLVDVQVLNAAREARRWNDYVAGVPRTSLYPGIAELVAELARRDIPWAVVTNIVSKAADPLMQHHGLKPSTAVRFHDVSRPKPHPEMCLLALQRLSADATTSLGVGDSAVDCQAFRSAGIRALRAGWNAQAESVAWDQSLAHPLELLALLQGSPAAK